MATPTRAVPRLLSVAQMAEVSGFCTKTVSRWIKAGDLPHHKIGRSIRIAEDDARSFIIVRRK
jgi:excisionase family DNA binding protein